jgi:hypothetical protein
MSNGTIKMKLDIDCEGKIVYPNGINKTIGHAEWREVNFDVNITQ